MRFPWPIIETISGRDPQPAGRLVNWLTHWHRAIVIFYLYTYYNIFYYALYCIRVLRARIRIVRHLLREMHSIMHVRHRGLNRNTSAAGDRGATMGKGGGGTRRVYIVHFSSYPRVTRRRQLARSNDCTSDIILLYALFSIVRVWIIVGYLHRAGGCTCCCTRM